LLGTLPQAKRQKPVLMLQRKLRSQYQILSTDLWEKARRIGNSALQKCNF
jgi:hypothetical protein